MEGRSGKYIAQLFLEYYYDNDKDILDSIHERDTKVELYNHHKSPTEKELSRGPGANIAKINIPKAGEYTLWDLAGHPENYVTHNMFLRTDDTVFILVIKITDKEQEQEEQLNVCLAAIKSLILKSIEESKSKPTVIFVASGADLVENQRRPLVEVAYAAICKRALERFGKYLNILDENFILDFRKPQHKDMDKLRECLKLGKNEKHIPNLCKKILDAKERWLNSGFPIMKWDAYADKVKEVVDLPDEETRKKSTRALHNLGEIVQIESTRPDGNAIIVLDLQWCSRIIGSMLAAEVVVPYSKQLPKKKMYSSSDLKDVLRGFTDINLLIDLFKELELLFETNEGTEIRYIIPGLLDTNMPITQWKPNATKTICYGRRFQCRDETDSFSPGLFPRLQVRLQRHFREMNRSTADIWKNGIKICHKVEALVYMTKGWRAIHVCVRAEKEGDIQKCYKMLETVTHDVYSVINVTCPGTNIETHILSAHSLRNQRDPENFGYYPLQSIIEAEQKNGKVFHEKENKAEEIGNLLCIGYDSTVIRNLKYHSDVKWMLSDTLEKFSAQMDIKSRDGQIRDDEINSDYEAMADLMGINKDEIIAWKKKCSSLTKCLLSEWSRRWTKRKPSGASPTEDQTMYESTFTNLLKILQEKFCPTDHTVVIIKKMFRNLGI
ncbi:death-associated protein kinase 1-like [Ptychodera flava]|uniref:death-associated protein kinase 1-like n=1 Tax=Ptychodera flava TaxID=63121 RepID=UPI00396A452A